jgi:hypothetical protein
VKFLLGTVQIIVGAFLGYIAAIVIGAAMGFYVIGWALCGAVGELFGAVFRKRTMPSEQASGKE